MIRCTLSQARAEAELLPEVHTLVELGLADTEVTLARLHDATPNLI